jgi:chromosome segregation ATPase
MYHSFLGNDPGTPTRLIGGVIPQYAQNRYSRAIDPLEAAEKSTVELKYLEAIAKYRGERDLAREELEQLKMARALSYYKLSDQFREALAEIACLKAELKKTPTPPSNPDFYPVYTKLAAAQGERDRLQAKLRETEKDRNAFYRLYGKYRDAQAEKDRLKVERDEARAEVARLTEVKDYLKTKLNSLGAWENYTEAGVAKVVASTIKRQRERDRKVVLDTFGEWRDRYHLCVSHDAQALLDMLLTAFEREVKAHD